MTFLLTFQRTRNFQLNGPGTSGPGRTSFPSRIIGRSWAIRLLWRSLCVVICLVIAFPVAYGLATRFKAFENEIKVLITFAFITDATLKTLRLGAVPRQERRRQLSAHRAWVFRPTWSPSSITDWATLLGMVYSLSAFAIFTIYLSISNIDRSLILAAYDAGAGKIRAHWEVTLPLCKPGIWAGSVLIFLLSVGVFPRTQGAGRRQVAHVGRTHPPDLRDPRQLAPGRRADIGADGGRGLCRPAVFARPHPQARRAGTMMARLEDRAIDFILSGQPRCDTDLLLYADLHAHRFFLPGRPLSDTSLRRCLAALVWRSASQFATRSRHFGTRH